MGLPMGPKLVKSGSTWARLCGTHIFETSGWIYIIQSSIQLSRPVVVQHQGHLTFTLDFQGQILKMLYLKNGRADWHGMKGKWVDRMLYLLCDLWLWLWPWNLKGKYLKSSIIGIRGWIDINGCESIGCWTQVVTLNFYLTLDLGFQGQIFDSHILGMGRSIDLEWKRCELNTMLDAQWAFSWSTVHGK